MSTTRVFIVNDNPQSLSVTYSDNGNMDTQLPSHMTVQQGTMQYVGDAQADKYPWHDSIFTLTFNGAHSVKVNLATKTTTATPSSFPDGTTACLVAPMAGATSWGWETYYFSGPGVMTPLANSLITANLPSILNFVRHAGISVPFLDGWKLTLTNLNASSFQCTYAGMSPTSGQPQGVYTLNVVLSASLLGARGTITGPIKDFPLNFDLTNAMVCTSIVINTNLNGTSLQHAPQMTLLKCSIGGLSLFDQTLFQEIPGLSRDGVGDFLPNQLAEAINDSFNTKILGIINKYIRDALKLPTVQAPTNVPIHRAGEGAFTPSIAFDPSRWMSNSVIQNKRLIDLKIPGTHDSGTYSLSNTLSQMIYGDIAFLWNLSRDTAPVRDGYWPIPPLKEASPTNPYHLGAPLYDFVMDPCVNSMSRAQPQSITDQLKSGIRWFDMRVYLDSRDSILYTQHALRGLYIHDLLSQILQFMVEAKGQELIFVGINNTNFKSQSGGIAQLTSLIKYVFQNNMDMILFEPDTVPGQTGFPFQSLRSSTVASIVGNSSKVMFMNTSCNDTDNIWFPNADRIITNTDGIAGPGWSEDIQDVNAMWQHEEEGIAANLKLDSPKLFSLGWTLPVTAPIIINSTLSLLQGIPDWGLGDLATRTNAVLPGFWKKWPNGWNVCSMDWPQYGTQPTLTQQVIAMNFPAAAE